MSRPGDRLRALAVQIVDQRTMERVVDPLLADLEMEYAEATQQGRLWKRRWILVCGYVGFLKTLTVCQAGDVMRVSQGSSMEDREALTRALKLSAAVGVLATLALAVPAVLDTPWGWWHPSRLVVYAVPAAIVVSVPIGFTVGILIGLRGRTLSARLTGVVLACAIGCSCACLATWNWLVPWDTQQVHLAVVRQAHSPYGMRDMNELTLGELGGRLHSSPCSGLVDCTPQVLAFRYHMRWALSCATLVLALFALATAPRIVARWALALAALCVCFGYYALLLIGQAGTLRDALPAFVGAWLPNAVFAVVWLVLVTMTMSKQNTQTDDSRAG